MRDQGDGRERAQAGGAGRLRMDPLGPGAPCWGGGKGGGEGVVLTPWAWDRYSERE